MKGPIKKIIYPILILIALATLFPLLGTHAAEYKERDLILNVPIGDVTQGQVRGDLLGRYFKAWYDLLLGSVGIIATVVIMWGGFKWLSSRGDTKQISDAQDVIFSAITGLVLTFGSYLIISLINPDLTEINMPEIGDIEVRSKYDAANAGYSKGGNYDGLGESTQTDGQLGQSRPENKNNGPKVPCSGNSDGQKDYGMAYVASHEGYRSSPYTDAIQTNTQNIYFGHQIQPGETFNGTEQEARQVLKRDYDKYQDQARDVASQHGVNFNGLSAGRQVALTDMAYNMGGASLNKFNNMWSAIKANDFEKAGKEILNSKYYNQLKQTGRPQMNADIMAASPAEGNDKLVEQASVNCQ